MRIAVDCTHHSIPGGIRTYLQNIVSGIAEVGPENEYILYHRGWTPPSDPMALPSGCSGQQVHVRAPGRVLDFLEGQFSWPRLERWTGDLDVVHGVHFVLPPTAPTVRRVLTVHDVTYLRHPDYYTDRRLNDYGYRDLLPRALEVADGVIALSHSSKQDIVELCGIDPERIFVVPHGLDPRIKPASEGAQHTIRTRLGLDGPFVVYPVGTLEIRKNIERTLESFSRAFPGEKGDPDLLLTGVGTVPADFRAAVSRWGLESRVRLERVGYPDDLAALMSAAEWGLYPSLYEGFGLPPLEAMACGLPMLVSNRTSCPEVAGDAALVVDPTDIDALSAGMRRLHEDASLREGLSRRGRERATSSGFQWARAARQTLAVYRGDREAYEREIQPLAIPQIDSPPPVLAKG